MKEREYENVFTRPLSRILFLCTHNSVRSQMAESLLRVRGGEYFTPFSAGTSPEPIHPLTIRVMAEIGISFNERSYRSKHLNEFLTQPPMDLVVTVCDKAAEQCPHISIAKKQEHWGFPDPSHLSGSEREQIAAFRHVRDLIAVRINWFVQSQQKHAESFSCVDQKQERVMTEYHAHLFR